MPCVRTERKSEEDSQPVRCGNMVAELHELQGNNLLCGWHTLEYSLPGQQVATRKRW